MRQLDEARPGRRIEAVPVGAQIGRSPHVEQPPVAAVGTAGIAGQAGLDRRAEAIVIRARGQRRPRTDLQRTDGEGVEPVAMRRVEELVLILRHDAGAERGDAADRGRDVEFQAEIVVAAVAGARLHPGGVERPLAHEIDAAGGIARAAEQSGRPPQHFEPVVEEQVGHRRGEVDRQRRDAVDQIVVDREAAREERRVLAADAVDGDAVGRGQRVFEREEVLRLDLFAVDDGYRVWRVLERRDGLADAAAIALADDEDLVLALRIGGARRDGFGLGRRGRHGRGTIHRSHACE